MKVGFTGTLVSKTIMNLKRFCILAGLFLVPLVSIAQVCEVNSTNIPADIPVPNADATASTFQQFSWENFLGINAAVVGGPPASKDQDPLWRSWSTVVDVLSCQVSPRPAGCECLDGNCSESGTRFYPGACRAIPDFQNYRVLGQRGQFDDSFLEAETNGLSNSPVLDRFGNFLRYEILVSPVTYDTIIEQSLWDWDVLDANEENLNLACGTAEYTGGDPAHPDMGDIQLKVAWLDADDEVGEALNLNHYYTDDLLVYTPAYRTTDGVERCELRTMAMVGMHITHKTLRQPGRIWATFEHRDLAPNCTERMPGSGITNTNMSCPSSVEEDFTLYGMQCNEDDPECAACNVTPESNDDLDICRNPTTPELIGWCLDQGPAAIEGTSKLCRHVAVEPPEIENVPAPIPNPLPDNYPQAAAWNQACVNELVINDHKPWSHYMLISGQWLEGDLLPPEPKPPATLECLNLVEDVFGGIVNPDVIQPKVETSNGGMKPFLGNITMESYGKSNCIGCHSRGSIRNSEGEQYNTDFAYFPSLNVYRQDNNFMTHRVTRPTNMCETPGFPAVLEFDLTGGAAGARVAEQSMNVLLGIEFPENLPDPEVSATDFEDFSQRWTHNGQFTQFIPDPSCSSGSCEVDRALPAEPGQRWLQLRTDPALQFSPDVPLYRTHIILDFPGLTCSDINPLEIRLWVSDDSQSVYANQVDSDNLAATLYLLPEAPPPMDLDYPQVPTLSRNALLALMMVLLLLGLREVRRF